MHRQCQTGDESSRYSSNTKWTDSRLFPYNVHPVFAAQFIYRHSKFDDDRSNIADNCTAAPSKNPNGIHASGWIFLNGDLSPNGFQRSLILTYSQALTQERRQILEQYQLTNFLGFQADTDGMVGPESTNNTGPHFNDCASC